MDQFTIGGQTIRVLDISAERDGHRVYSEQQPSFAERAAEIAKYSAPKYPEGSFLCIYNESCCDQIATTPEQLFKLSLTGQSYLYPTSKKRVKMACSLMVFYKKNQKLLPLWKFRAFEKGQTYPFLNPKELQGRLHKVLGSVKLSLGQLTAKGVPSIAWKVETRTSVFYIPWHNGCIIKEDNTLSFEEKELSEMKRVYALLRFAPSDVDKFAYKVLCC